MWAPDPIQACDQKLQLDSEQEVAEEKTTTSWE